ncbi:MAG: lysine--tRNA ligase [Thermoplasmata archaeon]
MYWADALIENLTSFQRVSTGISPSGPIHVGNMREILTGDIIYRSLQKKGIDADFIYLCDNIDPLRKVYPFLDQSYSKYVGMPLYRIPAPDGNGTYSEYFLSPFIEVMKETGIKVNIIRTSELYRQGILAEAIDLSIKKRSEIKNILESISGRSIEGDFFPYEPICEKCGKITTTKVISYSYPYVEYTCSCGYSGFSDIRKDEGKMPWRVEWPAKWYALHVSIEPFGKDHGAPGGSYDTGKEIAKTVFGIDAPLPLTYERIILKGKGAMHSSTGINISASDMIKAIPPVILRFVMARSSPLRHIDFDPGLGMLNLIDEFEKYQDEYFSGKEMEEDQKRIIENSLIDTSKKAYPISFRHLVTLVQIYTKPDEIIRAARSSVGENIDENDVSSEIYYVKNWLASYAPDTLKFKLSDMNARVDLTDGEKKVLEKFLESINKINWESNDIHNEVHEILKESNIPPEEGFSAFYKVLINKVRGPRLGYFLYNLGKEYTVERIKKALES